MENIYDDSCNTKKLLLNNVVVVERFYNIHQVMLLRTTSKITNIPAIWIYGFRVKKIKTIEESKKFRLIMYSKYGIS